MNAPNMLTRAALLLSVACDDTQSASPQTEGALAQTQDCDRACLIERAKAVFDGGKPKDGARLTENGVVVAVGQSWMTRTTNVHIHNAYADQNAGQVMLVGTADDPNGPAIFGLRAKFTHDGAQELEFLIAHDGEASLFPSKSPASQPVETDTQYEQLVPDGARDSAETMVALANRYFDGIEASGDPDLPVADACNRVENGVQTTRNPRFGNLHCNTLEPFVYIPVVEQRRFPIVDEARGVVAAIVVFQIPGGDYELELGGQKIMRSYTPRALYLFEAFKVAEGKIQQIEATMRNLDYGTQIDWPSL